MIISFKLKIMLIYSFICVVAYILGYMDGARKWKLKQMGFRK